MHYFRIGIIGLLTFALSNTLYAQCSCSSGTFTSNSDITISSSGNYCLDRGSYSGNTISFDDNITATLCIINSTNISSSSFSFGSGGNYTIVNNSSNTANLTSDIIIPDATVRLEGNISTTGTIELQEDANLTLIDGSFEADGSINITGEDATLNLTRTSINIDGNFQISENGANVNITNSDMSVDNFQIDASNVTFTGGASAGDCSIINVNGNGDVTSNGNNVTWGDGGSYLDLCPNQGDDCGFNQVDGSGFSCGTNTTNCNCTPTLPIKLLSFYGTQIDDVVQLYWVTAVEKNNDFFTIQRSTNGLVFRDITQVNGAGDSQSQREYQYLDPEAISGITYYRLKQTDFDGTISYSKVIAFNHATDLNFKLSPNPSHGIFLLQFEEQTQLLGGGVFNVAGQEVYHLPLASLTNHTVTIPEATPGIYVVKVQTTNGIFKEKIVIE